MHSKRLSIGLLGLVAVGLSIQDAAAQGPPVDTGSHIPVALMFLGAVVLGLGLAYGIFRNRYRTATEKRMTEQTTKAQYAAGDREER